MLNKEQIDQLQENFVALCQMHKDRSTLIADVIDLAVKHLDPPPAPRPDVEQLVRRANNKKRALDGLRKLSVQLRES